MLDEELIDAMRKLRDDEDNSLWKQGDLLRDNALTKAEMRKLAELLQRKTSTLEERKRVSTETPSEYRRTEYAWTIYKEFTRIEDPAVRWQLMFSRKDWTYNSAKEAVNLALGKPVAPVANALSKAMVVGDILIKAKLDKGTLTIKAFVGESYDVDVSQNERITTIELTE